MPTRIMDGKGVQKKKIPRIFSILRPLLRQHWAAIGCTKNGLWQQYVDEGSDAEDCEKTQFFLNTLYHNFIKSGYSRSAVMFTASE